MLLNSTNDEIVELIETYEKNVEDLEHSIMVLAWYMRGSLSFSEAYNLSESQRKLIHKIIDKNLETTKKSGLPFF